MALSRQTFLGVARWLVPLCLFSQIPTLWFLQRFGLGQRLSNFSYLQRSTPFNDRKAHERFVIEAAENWSAGRVGTLSVIDEKDPANSFPQYQFYGPGAYYPIGLLQLVLRDLRWTRLVTLGLMNFVAMLGVYLWGMRLSSDRWSALACGVVLITTPYHLGNFFGPLNIPLFTAISEVPLLSYLAFRCLTREKPANRRDRVSDALNFMGVVLLGALFFTSHNISALLTTSILGFPFLWLVRRECTARPFPFGRLTALMALTASCILFYWIPILRDYKSLVMTSQFSSFGAVFGMTQFKYLFGLPSEDLGHYNIGWGVLAAGVFFYSKRTRPITALGIFLIALMGSPSWWHYVPSVFHVIQFPGRLLDYLPLLLVFQIRPISRRCAASLVLLAVTIGWLHATRMPVTPPTVVRHDTFPATDYANYFRNQFPTAAPTVLSNTGKWSARWDPFRNEYVFSSSAVSTERKVPLPIFFLPENEFRIGGRASAAETGMLVQKEGRFVSYSIVTVPAGLGEIRVRLNGHNPWKWGIGVALLALVAHLLVESMGDIWYGVLAFLGYRAPPKGIPTTT